MPAGALSPVISEAFTVASVVVYAPTVPAVPPFVTKMPCQRDFGFPRFGSAAPASWWHGWAEPPTAEALGRWSVAVSLLSPREVMTVVDVQGGTMGSLVGYYRPADGKGFRITVWPITLWLLWVGGRKHPWLVEKTNHGALRFAVGINALYAVADLRMHEWSKLMALSNVSIYSRSPREPSVFPPGRDSVPLFSVDPGLRRSSQLVSGPAS
jgi:hypothetical protein